MEWKEIIKHKTKGMLSLSFVLVVAVSSVFLNRFVMFSILEKKQHEEFEKNDYYAYGLVLCLGMSVLCLVACFLMATFVVLMCFSFTSYYKNENSLTVMKDIYRFVVSGFHRNGYMLWWVVSAFVVAGTIITVGFIDWGRNVINRYYEHGMQRAGLNDDGDENDERRDQKHPRWAMGLIDDEQGIGFLYKIVDTLTKVSFSLLPLFSTIAHWS